LAYSTGKESTGANSIAIKKENTLIIVGGDFTQKNDTTKNCFISFDGGASWRAHAITYRISFLC
jgi:hypothetical protein